MKREKSSLLRINATVLFVIVLFSNPTDALIERDFELTPGQELRITDIVLRREP